MALAKPWTPAARQTAPQQQETGETEWRRYEALKAYQKLKINTNIKNNIISKPSKFEGQQGNVHGERSIES